MLYTRSEEPQCCTQGAKNHNAAHKERRTKMLHTSRDESLNALHKPEERLRLVNDALVRVVVGILEERLPILRQRLLVDLNFAKAPSKQMLSFLPYGTQRYFKLPLSFRLPIFQTNDLT